MQSQRRLSILRMNVFLWSFSHICPPTPTPTPTSNFRMFSDNALAASSLMLLAGAEGCVSAGSTTGGAAGDSLAELSLLSGGKSKGGRCNLRAI